MSIEITVQGGTSKKLLTGGKYCPDDIVVTAEGGGSGVSIETFTGTIYGYGGLGEVPDRYIIYTDETLSIRSIVVPPGEEATITVAKNTVIMSSHLDLFDDCYSEIGTTGASCFILDTDGFTIG